MYIVFVIANLVPAGHYLANITWSAGMVGRYHMYIVCVIANLVSADHANITWSAGTTCT
jgi:hypothetical protein